MTKFELVVKLEKIRNLQAQLNASKLEFDSKITDKEMAILMLCRTNKVWDFVSPELQKDPDVMMCYQPTGYVSQAISAEGYNYILGYDRYVEPEFARHQVREHAFFLVPTWAKDIEDFDYERYGKLQQAMLDYSEFYDESDGILLNLREEFNKLIDRYPLKSKQTLYGHCKLCLFSRAPLRKAFGVEDQEFEPLKK